MRGLACVCIGVLLAFIACSEKKPQQIETPDIKGKDTVYVQHQDMDTTIAEK